MINKIIGIAIKMAINNSFVFKNLTTSVKGVCLNNDLIIESVKKTNRLVTVEESWSFASVGSEIVSLVQKEAFDYLDAPINKINSADVPMPYSSVLEKQYLPQVEDIITAVEEVCYI